MATHKSAIKRHRQSLKRREANRVTKSISRTSVKKAREAIANKADPKTIQTLIIKAEKTLTTAARKNKFHKNNVARKISRLHKALKKTSK